MSDRSYQSVKRVRKLTDTDVKAIFRSCRPLADLAEEHGVSAATISSIRRGRRKQLVTGAAPPPAYMRGIRLELHRLTALERAIQHLAAAGILRPESRAVPPDPAVLLDVRLAIAWQLSSDRVSRP